jgi:hypothetical protein
VSDTDALSYDAWENWSPEEDHPPIEASDDEAAARHIDDRLEGETLEERNARIRARNDHGRQADRPDGSPGDPWWPQEIRVPVRGADKSPRRGEALAEPRQRAAPAAVRVTDLGGNVEWQELGNDTDAIFGFIAERAKTTPFCAAKLLRPQRPGRPTPEEAERRAALAVIVAAARDRGAKYEALASVLGRPLVSVAKLETDGRKLSA